MLVLSRKNQQSIKIGDIVITVVATRNGRAKIGITAPENVRIRRAETTDCEAERREELVGQC
jgi:carbon storage regulator CsrA